MSGETDETDQPEGQGAGDLRDPAISAARVDRNWNELMQELRVVQTGVQLLTGFLVTIPFTDAFGRLDAYQRAVYLCLLVGSVLTTGAIVAPVAYHRLLFRRRRRLWLVESANQLARAGLVLLAVVCSGVVLFVTDVVVGRTFSWILAGAVLAVLLTLWLVAPLALSGRSTYVGSGTDRHLAGRDLTRPGQPPDGPEDHPRRG